MATTTAATQRGRAVETVRAFAFIETGSVRADLRACQIGSRTSVCICGIQLYKIKSWPMAPRADRSASFSLKAIVLFARIRTR